MPPKAYISEIMSTIQGEGLYIGRRQIFVRFAGCNLDCQFCDTEFQKKPNFRLEKTPGEEDFVHYPNPLTVEDLCNIIKGFDLTTNHSISLTGGEPLMWGEFLNEFLLVLKGQGLKVFLETNGTLVKPLESLIKNIDIIAMDIKLPSTTGIDPKWEEHYDFLSVAAQKECFVKMVVSNNTAEEEFIKACELIKKISCNIPLIIQPVTPSEGNNSFSLTPTQIFRLQDIGLSRLNDVRIIPQTHKFMGLL